jgi:starch synthase
MKIIHATAEMYPYAKTGGLGDVVGSLATTLADKGHNISVFMPGYRAVFEHPAAQMATFVMGLSKGGGEVRAFSPRINLTIFLLCNALFFDRDGIYGADGHDFDDNHRRFIYFIKGVVEAMSMLKLHADVVHCHDWQTALLPMMLRYAELQDNRMLAKRTVFTVHNMAFQGKFPIQVLDRVDLPDEMLGKGDIEQNGQINLLKSG